MKEAENRLNPENLQIPADWNFPEKGKPGLKVVQIDLGQRFVAFDLPDNPVSAKLKNYKGEYYDYIFDPEGNPLETRKHSAFDRSIRLRGDIRIKYYMHEWAGPSTHADLDIVFSKSELGNFEPPAFELGDVNYSSGFLETVSLGTVFTILDQEHLLRSPLLIFRLVPGKSSNIDSFWPGGLRASRLSPEAREILGAGEFILQEGRRENEAIVFSQKEEQVFKINWGIQEGEQNLGKYLVI